MGAEEPVVEGGNEAEAGVREGNVNKNEEKEEEEAKDLKKGEVDFEERAIQTNHNNAENRHTHEEFQHSMYHRLNPTNPLRIVMNSNTRVASPSPVPAHPHPHPPPPPSHPHPHPPPPPSHPHPHPPPSPPPSTPPPESQPSEPRSIPILQPQRPVTLNSRRYTNRISLFLFLVHFFLVVVLVCFLVFKGIQGLIQASDSIKKKEKRFLKFFLPQVEAACLISIILAFIWQKAIRKWPTFMVHFILWCSFLTSLAAGVLLLCFQIPSTNGVGICLIAFSVGNGLYACWVNNRIKFCCKILSLSLQSVSKFPDLIYPTYCMLGASFLWMTLWTVAVIGAMNFVVPPLIIMVLMLSLAWITEVMRNVVNITVSRVISLYYLRGMQSSTKFCFLRAVTRNLGSACLGSLFVPTIEALRIIARGLNLLEGQDEFMFCCAHCCLRVMESIFRNGNSWAYVQIAAYGKGFVTASQDTWALFQNEKIEHLVNSDITSSICFLTGVCSGSICVIVVAAWTAKVHHSFTATLSLLTFFIGYLLTRIAMAVPHACVSCYYVCYAENPENRLFDKTIKDRLALLETHKDATGSSRV